LPSRTFIRNSSRIETAGGQITLDTSGLTVGDVGSGDITATTGAVLIDSDDTISFGAAGMVTADDLGVIANGATTINSTVSNLAVQKTGSGAFVLTNTGALTIADLSGLDASLNVTSIAADADSSVTASSPITFAANATSNVGSGNTMTWTSADDGGGAADDNITVNTGVTVAEAAGSLTFDSGDAFVMNAAAVVSAAETLTIDAEDGATQAAGGTILTDELLLTGSDDFDLQGAANNANTIAANITGALTWTDADGFAIGSVDGTDGLTSTTTITLDAGGSVSQTEAIAADELLMLGGIDYVLFNAGNDVNTIAADADDFAFADADGFIIGSINGTDGITANSTITLSAGDAVTQTEAITGTGMALLGGDDYTLTNAANDIDTLAGDVDDLTFRDADGFTIDSVTGTDGITATGTVQFTAGAAVGQNEAISAVELLLLGGVDYTLFDAGNDVNTIAADADDFAFADADGFVIGSINGTDGITANALITLSAGGAVTQTESITATDLLLLGGNDYTLTNANNDIDTLAGVTGQLSFTDSDTLTIGTVGGTVGLAATDDVALTAANNLLIDDDITINAGSAATFTARADGDISVSSNTALQATGSAVDIILNADRNADSDGAIVLNDGSSIASAGGDIVLGGGNNPFSTAAVSTNEHGIHLDNADLDSGGGDIHLTGRSDGTDDLDRGVFIIDSSLQAGGGDIDIDGTTTGAGSFRIGAYIHNSSLDATGSGQINLTGVGSATSGASGYGLYIQQTNVTTDDGDIVFNGAGGGTGDGAVGVYLINSSIAASGAGAIDITGDGGADSNRVASGIVSSNTDLSSVDGDITLTGTGGGDNTENYGVHLTNGSTINATGNGGITLVGTGGGTAGGAENDGLFIEDASVIAADGNITLTGTDGVSNNVDNSAGVHIDNSTIRSTAGNIALTGTRSAGDASTGIWLENAAAIGGAADPGSLTFTADAMAMNATNDVVIRGAGDLIIQPESNATTIGLGDGATGSLQLSAQELSALQAGFSAITIGRANLTGAMHVTDVTLLDPATLRTTGALSLTGDISATNRLTLHTGAITQSAGSITAPDLEVRSTGNVDLEQLNDVNTIAIDADGHIVLRDTDGLIIGAVGGTAGLSAGGDIRLTAGGNVTQTAAINADDLSLLGAVDYGLEHADNDVNTIAADAATLRFVDANDLTVGPANGTVGIAATGNVTLSTGGDLSIESAIDATTVDLNFGDAGGSAFDATAPITGIVSITGGGFDDTVRLAVLANDLTVDGGGGVNTLHLDDAGETTGHTYTVAEGMIQRQSTLRTLAFDDIAAVQITAGSGDDTVFSSFIEGLAQVLDGGSGVNLLDFDPRPATLTSKLSPLTAPGFGDVVHRNFTFAIIPLTFDFDSADGDTFFLSDRTGRTRMAQRSNSGVRDSGYDAQRAGLDADLLSDTSAAEVAALRRARGRLLYRRAELAYRLGPARRTALVALSSHDLFATDAATQQGETRIVEVHESGGAE